MLRLCGFPQEKQTGQVNQHDFRAEAAGAWSDSTFDPQSFIVQANDIKVSFPLVANMMFKHSFMYQSAA